jgi:predicted DsbA family dithiol-disulfide isomerase
MESWSVGFEGDADVERHAGIDTDSAHPEPGDSRSRRTIRLRVVSDYICPWCFVGLTRLEKLREEYDIELEVGAFELRPGIPSEGMSREEMSRGRVYPPGYLDNLRATAAEAGIEMKRPALVPNTRKAHETTEFAKEHGRLWEIHRALFHAYFEEERDIGDVDVLCDIAAGIGLAADELRVALADGRYAPEVEEQLAWARAAGVTGVPTVIFAEKFAVVGAQEYAVYRDVAGRVASGRLSV